MSLSQGAVQSMRCNQIKASNFPLHFGRAQCFGHVDGIFDAWPADSPIIAISSIKGDSLSGLGVTGAAHW